MASLSTFTVDDLEVFSRALRVADGDSTDMRGPAARITEYLFVNLRCPDRSPACVLTTLYLSARVRDLPAELRSDVEDADPGIASSATCLVPVARTAAPTMPPQEAAIPLTDAGFARRPLLAPLFAGLGIDRTVLRDPEELVLRGVHHVELEAFVLRDLDRSPWVEPAARPLIAATGAKTLVAIGGGLPTGSLFVLALLSREQVTDKSVYFFRALAPAVKAALIPHALHPWGRS